MFQYEGVSGFCGGNTGLSGPRTKRVAMFAMCYKVLLIVTKKLLPFITYCCIMLYYFLWLLPTMGRERYGDFKE